MMTLKILNPKHMKFLRIISYDILKMTEKHHFSSTSKSEEVIKTSSSATSLPQSSTFASDSSDLLLLQNALQNHIKSFSIAEWKAIRNNLISTQKHINEINVDAIILGLCNSPTHLDIAKSYISFLKSEGLELNNASLGRLMKIYYLIYKSGQINENYRKEIIEIYDSVLKKHKILDSQTCENLIHGIVATDKWKNSLDLLNMIELTCKPSISVYSTIITRAFDLIDGDVDIGWKLLREMLSYNKQPKDEIFLSYLNRSATDQNTFKENLEKMLYFIEDNEILISRSVVEEMYHILQQLGYNSVNITTVTRSGRCESCKKHLKEVKLNKKEFNELSSKFLDQVLIRKDIFLKSLPEEVESFVKFVENTAPYDCVIDGLNVAYSCGSKNINILSKLLASTVKYFTQKQKKVLVIGREHMNKWTKEHMTYIRKNSSLFLTTNLSQDDPFLLYAALKSGPKTDFLSRDLMRSHAFLLGHDLKSIFRRWQIEHQYMILIANENGQIILKEPSKHSITAHKINSTWHLPFREFYQANPGQQFEIPQNWLCLCLDK